MVRFCVAYTLVGLLMLCPFVCGAAGAGHDTTHRHQASEGSSERSHGPAHCPEGGDNCICEGAVQPLDVRVPHAHDAGLPCAFAAILDSPSHPIAHLAWDGSLTGLAGRGDHPTVRALLQNYRC